MPELPEVEIAARRLTRAAAGATRRVGHGAGHGHDEDASTRRLTRSPGPTLAGGPPARQAVPGRLRRADAAGAPDVGRPAAAMGHAERRMRDRVSRLLVRLDGGRELRLREFGTQSARMGQAAALASRAARRRRWRASDRMPGRRSSPTRFAALIDQPRHLHPLLRDQRTVAGIGRSWVDEILWTARLSPFRKGSRARAGRGRGGCRTAMPPSAWAPRWTTTRRWWATRSPTSSRCRWRCTAEPGEPCPRCGTTHRGDPLQGLRALLLPRGADGRPRPQGPPALAAAQVGRPERRPRALTLGCRDPHGSTGRVVRVVLRRGRLVLLRPGRRPARPAGAGPAWRSACT